MRIAHFIHGVGLGGAQKVVGSIVGHSGNPNIHYFVYAAKDGGLRQEIERTGATVRVIERSLPKLDLSWVLQLRKQLIRDKIEMVHAHLFGDSLHGYLATKMANSIPMVMTIHTVPEGMTTLQKNGYRWLISRRMQVVACSQSVRDGVLQEVAGPDAQIQVIRNGIRLDAPNLAPEGIESLRGELGFKAPDIVIAAFGRLEKPKGYKFLIGAFSRLYREAQDGRLKLAFFGEGSLRAELENQVKVENLPPGSVVFFGFITNSTEILETVDLVAFSSLYEGLPIALLESMRAKKCIVATDIPGISEAVRDSREAILVPREDAEALHAGLQRAVQDEELRRMLGENANARFLVQFTEEGMCRQYEELYSSLAPEPTA